MNSNQKAHALSIKENLENMDPTSLKVDVQMLVKSKSQLRKFGEQNIMSSAYSTASNLANMNTQSRLGRGLC